MSDDIRAINQLVDEDGGLLTPAWIEKNADTSVLIEAIQELYGMVWYLAEENVADFITKRSDKRTEIVERALARYREGLELSPIERFQPLDYEGIANEATQNESYRQGLLDAARVARAQGVGDPSKPDCPADMVAVYLERLANGEQP